MNKKMILTLLAAFALVFKMSAQTATYGIDAVHSSVTFTVTHMGISEVEGKFKKFDGTIKTTGADFSNAQVAFTVDVSSVNTDNDMRDGHLQSDDFFNSAKWSQMKFVSTSFKKVDDKTYTIEGNLTIRDVTKKVTFTAKYGGSATNMKGQKIAGFVATSTINRKDFNVTAGKASVAVGDNVQIKINLEMVQQ
jgi:polyisoprenoid-binding protein YceI